MVINGNLKHPKVETSHKYVLEGVFQAFNPINRNPCNSRIYDKKAFEFHLREFEKKMKIESRKNKLTQIESLY